MLALVLAAALAASSAPPSDLTRSTLSDVCLPYVTGEASDTAALEFLGFVPTTADDDETHNYQSEDEAYLLRMTTTGSADDGNLNRACVIQARRGGFEAANRSIQPVLQERGFIPEADLPTGRAIWTKGGVTVSLRQNPGAAAVVRVTYSTLDAG
ncbi:hypothetical protein [Brevundimonas sp. Root1423]|uniref:hypothetical protein n=1 Tax=Brevundimonas sp. Root1423 TaxID=1736462 RepID=UPI0006FBD452|nr:hypothetical protein [Brevundimonas sp. Root1423]KQY96445.1 hypothetical protein ASD25_00720 [Brevundimonas sp. Root1423]